MSGSLPHLLIASTQSRAQLALQLLKVGKFATDIAYLLFQSAAHGRARLQAASPQVQEFADFIERESQPLYAAYKRKCFDITLAVLTEAAFCSRWAR